MSDLNGHTEGILYRVGKLEAMHIGVHNDITSLLATARVLAEGMTQVHTIVNQSLAKINVMSNTIDMIKESLYPPAKPKQKRKKR